MGRGCLRVRTTNIHLKTGMMVIVMISRDTSLRAAWLRLGANLTARLRLRLAVAVVTSLVVFVTASTVREEAHILSHITSVATAFMTRLGRAAFGIRGQAELGTIFLARGANGITRRLARTITVVTVAATIVGMFTLLIRRHLTLMANAYLLGDIDIEGRLNELELQPSLDELLDVALEFVGNVTAKEKNSSRDEVLERAVRLVSIHKGAIVEVLTELLRNLPSLQFLVEIGVSAQGELHSLGNAKLGSHTLIILSGRAIAARFELLDEVQQITNLLMLDVLADLMLVRFLQLTTEILTQSLQ